MAGDTHGRKGRNEVEDKSSDSEKRSDMSVVEIYCFEESKQNDWTGEDQERDRQLAPCSLARVVVEEAWHWHERRDDTGTGASEGSRIFLRLKVCFVRNFNEKPQSASLSKSFEVGRFWLPKILKINISS